MPVASAILFPGDMAQIVHEGTIECSGWAYSGGGHWIERVEVSADGGFTWHECPLENMSRKFLLLGRLDQFLGMQTESCFVFRSSAKYYHAMRLWHMKLPVAAEGWLEIVVRCWGKNHWHPFLLLLTMLIPNEQTTPATLNRLLFVMPGTPCFT